jgi:hypothetical protein
VNSISVMTFSKDRGPQLHAMLRSIRKYVSGVKTYYILYTCSDERNQKIYDDLISEFSDVVTFIKETSGFQRDVLKFLATDGAQAVAFSSDDSLYIKPVDYSDMANVDLNSNIPTIRLAPHLTHCHPVGMVPQKLPLFSQFDSEKLTWDWADGHHDWGYPLSLDGTVFLSSEMLDMASAISFKTPTSFESGLQRYKQSIVSNKRGVCYSNRSRLVSLPWNVVTQEINNPSGGMSLIDFLDNWEAGNQIVVDHIYESIAISCIQEYELKWETR